MVYKNNNKTKKGLYLHIMSVTKIFTKHNIKTAFRTKNTIGKLLNPAESKNK
jgi:hypothetical protein